MHKFIYRPWSIFPAGLGFLRERNTSYSVRWQLEQINFKVAFLEVISAMSASEKKDLETSVEEFWSLLYPRALINVNKSRLGSIHDGGYVFADDLNQLSGALSIGVGSNNDVDVILASMGIKVVEFDHTVKGPPKKHKNLHFNRTGLGVGKNLIDFQEMLRIADVGKDAILLCDIEGAEFEAGLAEFDGSFADFRQIAIELHWLENLADVSHRGKILGLLRSLTKDHSPIHVHANNNRPVFIVGGLSLPSVIEVTLVRNRDYSFGNASNQEVQNLDGPNNPYWPDPVLKMKKTKS